MQQLLFVRKGFRCHVFTLTTAKRHGGKQAVRLRFGSYPSRVRKHQIFPCPPKAGVFGFGSGYPREIPDSEVAVVRQMAALVAEGLAAGVWTIGIAASGNGVGLSREALDALPEAERAERVARARQALTDAGAHAVIDTIADLPLALAELPLALPDSWSLS